MKFKVLPAIVFCSSFMWVFPQRGADDPAANFSPTEGVTTRTEVYKALETRSLEMHLHFPSGWKETDRRPVMVFFFGGGWYRGTTDQFLAQADYFAARGLVTARADYRVKTKDGVSPDKCVEDARSAVRFLRKNAARFGIDPQKLIASGGSAGGHLAACTMIAESVEDPKDDRSISTVPQAMVLYNPALFYAETPDITKRVRVDPKVLPKVAPLNHVNKNTPPTLILFGTKDPIKEGGDEFVRLAKGFNIRADHFEAEGAGHGFFNQGAWKDKTMDATHDFLSSLGYLPPRTP